MDFMDQAKRAKQSEEEEYPYLLQELERMIKGLPMDFQFSESIEPTHEKAAIKKGA